MIGYRERPLYKLLLRVDKVSSSKGEIKFASAQEKPNQGNPNREKTYEYRVATSPSVCGYGKATTQDIRF